MHSFVHECTCEVRETEVAGHVTTERFTTSFLPERIGTMRSHHGSIKGKYLTKTIVYTRQLSHCDKATIVTLNCETAKFFCAVIFHHGSSFVYYMVKQRQDCAVVILGTMEYFIFWILKSFPAFSC